MSAIFDRDDRSEFLTADPALFQPAEAACEPEGNDEPTEIEGMMAKYRKKPIVVDAQQWFPPGDPRHDPTMLVHRKGNTVNPPDYRQSGDLYCAIDEKYGQGPSVFMIRTGGSNSDVQVHPGDWIITGIQGEKYPCKADIFEATYELVEDE